MIYFVKILVKRAKTGIERRGICTVLAAQSMVFHRSTARNYPIDYHHLTNKHNSFPNNFQKPDPVIFKHQKTIQKATFVIRRKKHKYLHSSISTAYILFFNIVREKACFLLRFFVSLHRQSKEQPFMPEGGHHRRPQRVLNDGRRRSSMKTRKSTGNGLSG